MKLKDALNSISKINGMENCVIFAFSSLILRLFKNKWITLHGQLLSIVVNKKYNLIKM